MNWNTLPLLDLIIPTEDWPRCACEAGQTTLTRRRREADQVWWCSVCNLPARWPFDAGQRYSLIVSAKGHRADFRVLNRLRFNLKEFIPFTH